MPVDSLTAELMGTIPSLPYLHSLQILNRAWSRVRDCRLWSWQLVADAEIFAPAAIVTGTCFAFYQSDKVRLDSTAIQAFQQAYGSPPIAGPLGTGRQIRICAGGSPPSTTKPRWDAGNQWNEVPPALWGDGTTPLHGRRKDDLPKWWYRGVGWVKDPANAVDQLKPQVQQFGPYSQQQGYYQWNYLQNGPNYTIIDWDGGANIQLDKPYGEPTVANSPFQVYKCYYSAPACPPNAFPPKSSPGYDQSLIRFLSLTNKSNGYTIRGKKLWYTQDMLNAIDPQRGATGDAYIIASYGRDQYGLPVFELYPNPVHQATYYVTYWTRWPDVGDLQDFPAVPYGLTTSVMDLARVFAGQWAMANVTTKPELQLTNWVQSITMYKQEFREGLIQCIKMDDEMSPARPFRQSSRFDFPLGGEFLQGHDVSSLIGWP